MKVSIKNKIFMFKFSPEKNTISKMVEGNDMKKVKNKLVGKKIGLKDEIIKIKLSHVSSFDPNKTGNLSYLTGGTVKINFKMYHLEGKSLKAMRNKMNDFDIRTSQFVFITLEHYEKHGIRLSDLKDVALLAAQNKLEKRLTAPKLINQIYKMKK